MSDYSKATNFTTKDTLPTGNSGKIVKGTELDTEFTAISSAIASKADVSSPNLLGTPTAPTASTGTSTTQLATTAFVTAALSAIYPVGSIYINATVSTNPATLLGFGTWAAFGAGKVIVGLDSTDTLFDTLEETGGSKDATLVSHSHTANQSGHSHFIAGGSQSALLDSSNVLATSGNVGSGLLGNENFEYRLLGSGNSSTANVGLTNTVDPDITVSTEGSSATNANVQPYIVVKMWKRTA
jgi:hypothetical protein